MILIGTIVGAVTSIVLTMLSGIDGGTTLFLCGGVFGFTYSTNAWVVNYLEKERLQQGLLPDKAILAASTLGVAFLGAIALYGVIPAQGVVPSPLLSILSFMTLLSIGSAYYAGRFYWKIIEEHPWWRAFLRLFLITVAIGLAMGAIASFTYHASVNLQQKHQAQLDQKAIAEGKLPEYSDELVRYASPFSTPTTNMVIFLVVAFAALVFHGVWIAAMAFKDPLVAPAKAKELGEIQ